MQQENGCRGDQSDFTFASLAKWERRCQPALNWIQRAKQAQSLAHNRMGLVRSLLLESRLRGDRQLAAESRAVVRGIRQQLPALAQCALLTKILANWDGWVGGQTPESEGDDFWGL